MLRNWSGDDGLPSSGLLATLQTKDGYLWFSTHNGLVRFNGKSFTVFNQSNTKEIQSTVFQELCEDRDGNMWVATNGSGLLRYREGRFTAFNPNNTRLLRTTFIEALCIDKTGKLWVGTDKGLLYAVPAEGFSLSKNIVFHEIPEFRNLNVIRIFQDAHSVLWISTQNNGLYRIQEGVVEHLDAVTLLLSGNKPLYDIAETPDSTIWIAAVEKGLVRYNYSTEQFSLFTGTSECRIDGNVYSLGTDKRGTLWIGSDRALFRYENAQLSGIKSERRLNNAKIYEDNEGNLWFPTYRHGLSMLRQGKFTMFGMPEGIAEDIIHCIKSLPNGTMLIGSENGLNILSDNTLRHFTRENGHLPNNIVRDIFCDKDNSVWIATHGGLAVIKNIQVTTPSKTTNNLTSRIFTTNDGLANNQVRAILQDKHDNYWFGTLRGLTYVPASSVPVTRKGRFGVGHRTYLADVFVNSLFEAKNGDIYVSTVGEGLFVIHPEGDVSHYTTKDGLGAVTITSIMEDHNGTVWICTNAGITKYANGVFRNYTSEDGLPSYNYYQILTDSLGNFWCATSNGILKIQRQDFYDVEKGTRPILRTTSFKKADGLRENQCTGNGHGCSDAKGRLWFATSGGAACLSPQSIPINTIPPPVYIEGLLLDTTYIRTDTMTKANVITIPPTTRTLSFNYAALSYSAPKNVRFRVLLEGFDKSWYEVDKSDVHYTNLPRGRTYILRIQACNNDGLWNDRGVSLELYYEPFFWETWWFYTIGGVFTLGLLYQAMLWRIGRLRAKAKRLSHTVQERTSELQIANEALQEQLETLRRTQTQLAQAEKMASLGTLVAGVAHELNTPIGVAVTAASTLHVRTQDFAKRYTEGSLKKSELEAYVQTAQTGADLTLSNLERAANLIQSFKQVSVDQTYDNIRRFGVKQYLYEIITSLQPKWKTSGHRVEIECDETLEMETYAGAIAQIITNFVTNSLLHGFEGYTEEGVMKIEAMQEGSKVVIKYSDNGRGIPPEILPRIFDPFFTTKQANGGTGLGMHIVYNLVTQKLAGTILVENQAGGGVRFIVQIPSSKF